MCSLRLGGVETPSGIIQETQNNSCNLEGKGEGGASEASPTTAVILSVPLQMKRLISPAALGFLQPGQ